MSPDAAAALKACAATWKLCSLAAKSLGSCQISGLAPVLPTSGPVPAGNQPDACFDRLAMVAAPDLTAGRNGVLEVISRRSSLLVSPIFSIPSWRWCMIASACFLGRAAKATPAATTERIAVAGIKWIRMLLLLLRNFPTVVDHLDDAREILGAAAAIDEPLV